MNIIIATKVLGIIFIGSNILYINAILACKIETTGTFIKYNTVHSGRGVTYEPVFRYYIKGEEFQGSCLNKMNLPDIQKQFAADQTYAIYVNDKKPGYFIIFDNCLMIFWILIYEPVSHGQKEKQVIIQM